MKNIFVSNLSFRLQNEDLQGIFEEYGEVNSAKIIIDKVSGRSRGFGFVEMPDDAALEAIEALNGSEVDGKQIAVSEARPREDRPRNNNNFGRNDRSRTNNRPKGGGGGRPRY